MRATLLLSGGLAAIDYLRDVNPFPLVRSGAPWTMAYYVPVEANELVSRSRSTVSTLVKRR